MYIRVNTYMLTGARFFRIVPGYAYLMHSRVSTVEDAVTVFEMFANGISVLLHPTLSNSCIAFSPVVRKNSLKDASQSNTDVVGYS